MKHYLLCISSFVLAVLLISSQIVSSLRCYECLGSLDNDPSDCQEREIRKLPRYSEACYEVILYDEFTRGYTVYRGGYHYPTVNKSYCPINGFRSVEVITCVACNSSDYCNNNKVIDRLNQPFG